MVNPSAGVIFLEHKPCDTASWNRSTAFNSPWKPIQSLGGADEAPGLAPLVLLPTSLPHCSYVPAAGYLPAPVLGGFILIAPSTWNVPSTKSSAWPIIPASAQRDFLPNARSEGPSHHLLAHRPILFSPEHLVSDRLLLVYSLIPLGSTLV